MPSSSSQPGSARTWWANAFMQSIENFTGASRLSRGRSYAKGRKVKQFKIDGGQITAEIRGSINPYFGVYEEPSYSITVEVEPIKESDWAAVIQRVGSKASTLSKLLVGEIPESIETDFEALGLHLLPKKGDFNSYCDCPDWNNPCKHIAGAYYLTAAELDKDPLKLFELRGLDRRALLEGLGQTTLGAALQHELAANSSQTAQPASSLRTVPTTYTPEAAIASNSFWQSPNPLPALEDSQPAQVPAILIKKQGDFPSFWQRSHSFIETMESFYTRVRTDNKHLLE